MNIFKISDAYLNQTSHLLSGKGSANLYPPPKSSFRDFVLGHSSLDSSEDSSSAFC